jgi:hypothetical protein
MPEKETIERAQRDKAQGKAPYTQAGEFVEEEMDHIRGGKHGARSPQQAIAIGLSKARRAGVKLPPPKNASGRTRKQAERDDAKGRSGSDKVSPKRSRATSGALKREEHSAASPGALSRQASSSASKRGRANRSQAARQAARTKGAAGRSRAASKAARTRGRHS